MVEIILQLNEDQMETFVKELLCLDDGDSWRYETTSTKLTIKHTGRALALRSKILDWLSVPERMNQITTLGAKIRSGISKPEDFE